jgi:hypothetical protein
VEAAVGLGIELMDDVMNGTRPAARGNRDLVEAPPSAARALTNGWRSRAGAMPSGARSHERSGAMISSATRDSRAPPVVRGRKQAPEAAIRTWTATRTPEQVVEALQSRRAELRPLSN